MSRRHRRRRRQAPLQVMAFLAVLAVLAGCSSSGDTGSRAVGEPPGAGPTTTSADPGADTTTAVPPDRTFPPVRTDLEPPAMPDPFDLVDAAMEPLAEFPVDDTEPTELLDTISFRLAGIVDYVMQAVVWENLSVDGEPVLVVGMYPYAGERANPITGFSMAAVAAGEDGDVEDVDLGEGADAWRTEVGDDWWYAWSGHSAAFLAVGAEGAVESVLAPLVAADAGVYAWETGDCLYSSPDDGAEMPYAPFGDDMVVPCDGPHSHYVLATTSFADDAGGVDADSYAALRAQCEETYEDHVGVPSHESVVDLIIYAPDEEEWARGDRYGACVIGRYLDGEPALVDDSYRGAGESVHLERRPGDCFGPEGATSPPVGCDQPHDYEYLGTVELDGDDDYPSSLAEPRARFACNTLLIERMAGSNTGEGRVDTYAWIVPEHRWEQGERTVHCFAYPVSENPESPVVIVGPLTGEWRIMVADDVVDA